MITLTGKKVSEGIAIGMIAFYTREIQDIRKIDVKDIQKEIARFQKAKERAIYELQELYDIAAREVGEANATIFEMQQGLLKNRELIDALSGMIVEKRVNAEYAVKAAAEAFIKDKIDKNHVADVQDIAVRLIRILSRSWKDRMFVDEPFVMAAGELYPSELIRLDTSRVLGIATRYGTVNSHTAVIARTKGIPMVVGLGDALKVEYEGKTIIVDGYEGKVYIEPDYTLLKRMKERQAVNTVNYKNLERLKGKENITQSGKKIDICANINSREDIEKVIRSDAGGVGLFRSEFLYLENQPKLPSEELQFQTYKLAAEAMGVNRVVIRTADLGGDKMPDVMKGLKEENPALGLRGIRVSMEKEDIFYTQVRAILRASAYGNLAIMFPMISTLKEVLFAKRVVQSVKQELKSEKIPYKEDIRVGVMIETPAAVMLSGELAREVDFFSIGTNDLTQFTLGVDRGNENVSRYYDPHHAAIEKMIRIVTNNAHLEEKPICVCGDLAGDLSMTEFFVGVGVDELSVSPEQVLPLRKKIREI